LNAAGDLEITSISANTGPATGNQPFLLSGSASGGGDSPRFVDLGMNRLYNLSGSAGQTLLYLDVSTMTYCPGVFFPPMLCRVLF
jgi:hypothetical protein